MIPPESRVLPSTASAVATPPARPVQVPIPQSAADVRGPVSGNTMLDAYVQLVGRMA